jgi:hypothetical protein
LEAHAQVHQVCVAQAQRLAQRTKADAQIAQNRVDPFLRR